MIFFFYYGTKEKQRKLGYVADYCPICRAIRPFQLFETGLAEHVYGVALKMKKTLGYQGICQSCKAAIHLNGTDYALIAKKPAADLEDLIASTFPEVRKARERQLNWQQRLEGLNAIQRRQALLEPFKILFEAAEAIHQGIQIGGRAGLTLVGSVVLAIAIVIGGNLMLKSPELKVLIEPVAWSVAGLGALLFPVLMFLEPGRMFRRKIAPLLALGLGPLQPTKAELEDCLARLRRADYVIGKKTKVEELWAKLG